MEPAGEPMTLVFNRAALERLADPQAAFADARQWSQLIAIVADASSEELTAFTEREGIEPDLVSGRGGQTGGLAAIRQQYAADRHVFVGTSEDDRDLAQSLGWEYLSVGEAADAAGWALEATDER